MVFELFFENPDFVSRSNQMDVLRLIIHDPKMFISKETLKRMDNAFIEGNEADK